MYRNLGAALLWLIPLAKYVIDEYNLKRSKADSCIFYKKDDNGKLELMISVHVERHFMARNLETLDKIIEMINLKFNIQEYVKVKKFLGVYYK